VRWFRCSVWTSRKYCQCTVGNDSGLMARGRLRSSARAMIFVPVPRLVGPTARPPFLRVKEASMKASSSCSFTRACNSSASRLDRDLAERYGSRSSHPIAESGAPPRRTVVPCVPPKASASGTALCLASPFSPVGHPLGIPRRELFPDGAPRSQAKSNSGICERLFVAQRHHGIDPHRTPSWDVAGDQSNRRKDQRCNTKRGGVRGAHTVEQ
jgi:hypothetical protein